MTQELTKNVDRAVRLIKSTVGDNTVEISYSGGKDSDVILELAKMAGFIRGNLGLQGFLGKDFQH